ncbi:MAG: HyaD/HybD family hydrogenase maturation endopeptidase [Terriglobales bacterium]|jgi:hydrogenase maturation protease
MRDLLSSDTVVIGVGNTILSDDGVGVHAARLLQDDPRVPAGITILDGGTIGLDLIPYASDASRLLLLDAVNSGKAPGTLTRMTAKDVLDTSSGWSVHQLGVADLIAALALMATKPQDIVVLGVQPANTGWGTSLSPDVEAALMDLVNAAVAQLQHWQQSQDASLEPGPPSLLPRQSSKDRTLSKPCEEGNL